MNIEYHVRDDEHIIDSDGNLIFFRVSNDDSLELFNTQYHCTYYSVLYDVTTINGPDIYLDVGKFSIWA